MKLLFALLVIAVSVQLISGIAVPWYCQNCPRVYQPVCGTDGRSYSNRCFFDCAQYWKWERRLPIAHFYKNGPCPEVPCTKCAKIPPAPVCGYDGRVYINQCYLNCNNDYLRSLGLWPVWLAYYGTCKPIFCFDFYIPVCGTDCKTYSNDCYRRDADIKKRMAVGKRIDLKYPEPCKPGCVPT